VNPCFCEKNGSYSRTTWDTLAYHNLGNPAISETKIKKDTGLTYQATRLLIQTQYAAGGVAIYAKDNIWYVSRHDLSEILTEAESL